MSIDLFSHGTLAIVDKYNFRKHQCVKFRSYRQKLHNQKFSQILVVRHFKAKENFEGHILIMQMSHWQCQRKWIQIFDFTEELLSFKEISNYPVQNRVVDLRILIWLHLKVKYFRFLDTEVLTDCWDFSQCGCSNITEWDNPSFTSNHYHLPHHQHSHHHQHYHHHLNHHLS